MEQIFSIIIPVYNEQERLPRHIDSIFTFFKKYEPQPEIIFVNDGSSDNTLALLQSFQEQYSFQIISDSINRGKGYAVRVGAQAAHGNWIVFFDIDLATPLSEFDHLRSELKPTDQVIIGSRRLPGSAIDKSESWLRVFLGHGFTKLSNLLVPRITDFTCGFKCFSHAAAAEIFSRALINRWGFDTELLYVAYLRGLTIRELAVHWAHDGQSKVKVGGAVASSLKELWQMKYNYWKGLYGKR